MKAYVGVCEWPNHGNEHRAFLWGNRIHVIGPGGSSHSLWGKTVDLKAIGIESEAGAGVKMASYTSPVNGDPSSSEPDGQNAEWERLVKGSGRRGGPPVVTVEVMHHDPRGGVSQRFRLWEVDI